MISQILLVAMVINVIAYVPSTLADATDLNAREFAVVLPFGAVLAGRTLSGPAARYAQARPAARYGRAGLRRYRVAAALLAGALLAGYGASLGYAAAQPSVPAANARLATFLAAHHLTSGIGGYWESSVVTVGSDGAVTIRAVLPGTLQPDLWEAKSSWYDSGPNRANVPGHRQRARILQPLAAQPRPRWRRWAGRPGPTTSVPTPCTSGTRTCWPVSGARDLARLRPAGSGITAASSRRATRQDAVVRGRRDVALACGSANIRGRERVRRYVHLPRAAAALARRGGALPLPARGVMGPEQQRLPQERGAALPRRGQPPGVRHARNATTCSTSWPTTRRGSGSWRVCSSTPTGGCARRASPATSTCSRTTPTRRATPTAATRTTWSAGTASSAGWPTS